MKHDNGLDPGTSRQGQPVVQMTLEEIQGPLQELAKHGRILGIMFERDGEVNIQFWASPTPSMLRALRKTYREIRDFMISDIRRAKMEEGEE